ncbi:hypothetical protein [Companilactobacillus insicii]|uniref:hypothetical protein n=1 Tax=Companilactobacillus insicii TaxID=1732567 RepID=UPI000F77363E|nr:hypothetical protein [Companilactobacillus insicii]
MAQNDNEQFRNILQSMEVLVGSPNEIIKSKDYISLKDYLKNVSRIPYVVISGLIYQNSLDPQFLDVLNEIVDDKLDEELKKD